VKKKIASKVIMFEKELSFKMPYLFVMEDKNLWLYNKEY
jgi:hypothetical protein